MANVFDEFDEFVKGDDTTGKGNCSCNCDPIPDCPPPKDHYPNPPHHAHHHRHPVPFPNDWFDRPFPYDRHTFEPHLRFFCSRALPLVYDDSLSYYELLQKVVAYLNGLIDDEKIMSHHIKALAMNFWGLQKYVDDYFSDYQNRGLVVYENPITAENYRDKLADFNTARMNTIFRLNFNVGSLADALPENMPSGEYPWTEGEKTLISMYNFRNNCTKDYTWLGNVQFFVTPKKFYVRTHDGDSWLEWHSMNEDDFANIYESITRLTNQLNEVTTNITNILNRVTTAEGKITQLESDTATLRTDVNKNTSDIADLTEDLGEYGNRLTAAENDIEENATEISGIKERLTTAESDIATNRANITENTEDITTLNTVVGNIDNRVTTNEGNIANNTSEINSLKTRVTTNEGNITNHATRLAVAESKIAEAESDIDTLEGRVTTLDTNVDNLTDTVADNYRTLDSRLDLEEAHTTSIDERFNHFNNTVKTVEQYINDMESDTASDISDIENRLNNFNGVTGQTVENYTSTVLAGEISDNADNINGVTTRLDRFDGSNNTVEQVVERLRSDVDNAIEIQGDYLPLAGGAMSGNIDMQNRAITGASAYQAGNTSGTYSVVTPANIVSTAGGGVQSVVAPNNVQVMGSGQTTTITGSVVDTGTVTTRTKVSTPLVETDTIQAKTAGTTGITVDGRLNATTVVASGNIQAATVNTTGNANVGGTLQVNQSAAVTGGLTAGSVSAGTVTGDTVKADTIEAKTSGGEVTVESTTLFNDDMEIDGKLTVTGDIIAGVYKSDNGTFSIDSDGDMEWNNGNVNNKTMLVSAGSSDDVSIEVRTSNKERFSVSSNGGDDNVLMKFYDNNTTPSETIRLESDTGNITSYTGIISTPNAIVSTQLNTSSIKGMTPTGQNTRTVDIADSQLTVNGSLVPVMTEGSATLVSASGGMASAEVTVSDWRDDYASKPFVIVDAGDTELARSCSGTYLNNTTIKISGYFSGAGSETVRFAIVGIRKIPTSAS